MRTIQTTLHGHLIGNIWMPNTRCSKPVSLDMTAMRDRLSPSRGGSLRYMVGQVCNDGDFQSAMLSQDSFIEVTCTTRRGSKVRKVSRVLALADLPEVADYVSEDFADTFED